MGWITLFKNDHLDYNIVKIGQNTKKGPGDLRRLAVTQTPVRNHQLTLVWKTFKGWNNNDNNNDKLEEEEEEEEEEMLVFNILWVCI